MTDTATRTLNDAEAAGRALVGAGACEVLVFGSVVRGDAVPGSDVDLVVVLEDLDYKQRYNIAGRLKKLASAAAGQRVDTWLTDMPEWAARNRRAASLAAAIQHELVTVAERPEDRGAVRTLSRAVPHTRSEPGDVGVGSPYQSGRRPV